MDERRMTADVELLPLPEWTKRDDAGQNMVPSEIRVSMADYARACVAHATAELHRQFGCELQDPNGTIWDHAAKLQAENEALRAEVAKQSAYAKRTHDWNTELLANNERLAEALIAWHKQATDKGRREREESPGHSHAVLGVWDSDNGKYAGVDCAQCALWFEATRLRAALNPTAAQENDDE